MKIIHYVFLCIKGSNIIVSDNKNNYYYSHSTRLVEDHSIQVTCNVLAQA